MIYPITLYGKAVLRQQAEAIPHGTDVKNLIEDMFATMDAADGVGLAAPQIGKSIQLFVIDITCCMEEKEARDDKPARRAYINPVVTFPEPHTIVYDEEGCLSIPKVYGKIPRHRVIKITFFDSDWNLQEETLENFPARVVQHEYDHLLGKLHIDYLLAELQGTARQKLTAQLAAIQAGSAYVK